MNGPNLNYMKKNILWKFLLLAACVGLAHTASAQTTAFTYQGSLTDGGTPANGSYDLTFTAFDAVSDGDPVSDAVTIPAVTVSNGLFTTTVDFGPEVFLGGDLWLEIGVSTNGADAFSTIAPRQMFTPTPYSLFAQTAGTANTVASSTISAPQLNTAGAPASGQVLAFNGAQLAWQDPVVGGSTGGWSLSGNLGTSPGANFLGTIDTEPMEIWAGDARAMRLEPDPTGNGSPNVIGGAPANVVTGGLAGATIAGGGATGFPNQVTASYGAIGGGENNTAGGQISHVGGGYQNSASGYISTIAGGAYNNATTDEASVLGGAFNTASGVGATIAGGGYDGTLSPGNAASGNVSCIGGGLGNATGGYAATIAGGADNSASGPRGFVGGGAGNIASGSDGVSVAVGQFFDIISGNSVVGGGDANTASATCATVPGGYANIASGDFSLAAGFHAQARNSGSFVWADDSDATQFSSQLNNQFIIRATNGVGIGTALTPPGGLRVGSGGLAVTGASSPNYQGAAGVFIEKSTSAGLVFGYNYTGNTPLPLCLNTPGGNVGIGTITPAATLDVNGITRTHSITITGGSDVAEPFKMGSQPIASGSVVVIDDQHPGELKLSAAAYDTRVAGIVSGANGINPGIALHQDGALEGGQNVALSGRVYVLADSSNGPIKPGDLLTTSVTPGHAMRVTNHARAQGAVIGKAMTSLDKGKGMVLVLVTLQ